MSNKSLGWKKFHRSLAITDVEKLIEFRGKQFFNAIFSLWSNINAAFNRWDRFSKALFRGMKSGRRSFSFFSHRKTVSFFPVAAARDAFL